MPVVVIAAATLLHSPHSTFRIGRFPSSAQQIIQLTNKTYIDKISEIFAPIVEIKLNVFFWCFVYFEGFSHTNLSGPIEILERDCKSDLN